jgi:hypothetical protein
VADGKACFACGYEWPKTAAPAPAPAPPPPRSPPPSSAAPATAVNARPNPNPFAPPQRGPMFSPPSTPPPTAAFGAPPQGAFGGAAAFGGTPSTQPLGSGQPNPFSAPPRAPTPMPRVTGVGAPGGSIAQTMTNALPQLAPLQAPPPPMTQPAAAGLPLIEVPPPAPLIAPPSNQAKKTGEGRGLAALFDDVAVPEAPTIADSADEAGDFMLTPQTARPPADPFAEDPALADLASFHDEPTADLAGGAPTADLGADLVAAFEAQTSDAALKASIGATKGGLIGGIDVDAELAALDGLTDASTASMPSPIVVRLRSLAERLRSEGRAADADVITQALVLIEAKSF